MSKKPSLLQEIRANLPEGLRSLGLLLNDNDRCFAKLRNIHQGKRCFIIGNGPSLRAADLEKMRNEISFAANKIYLLYPQTAWRPTYYNVEDALVATQNSKEIDEINGPKKFFRRSFSKILKDTGDVIWYRDDHEYKPFPQFSAKPVHRLFWGSSVTYINLQLAAFMGCSKMYLLGMDFNFTSAAKQSAAGQHVAGGEVNHFSPDYRKPGELWNQANLDIQLAALKCAQAYGRAHQFEIFNATRGGKLEVFPRVDFDSLF